MTLRAAGARRPRRFERVDAVAAVPVRGQPPAPGSGERAFVHRGAALLYDMLINLPCPKRPDGRFRVVPHGVAGGEKMWITPGRLG
jgi:hypothetical protein